MKIPASVLPRSHHKGKLAKNLFNESYLPKRNTNFTFISQVKFVSLFPTCAIYLFILFITYYVGMSSLVNCNQFDIDYVLYIDISDRSLFIAN